MAMKLNLYNGTQVVVPQRLEPAFKSSDKNGQYSLLTNNGEYDFLDTPMANLAHRLNKLVKSEGIQLKSNEVKFLKEKVGIDPYKGFKIDPNFSRKWINRWTLTKTRNPNFDPKKIDDLKIQLIFEGKVSVSDKEELEKIVSSVFKKLAKVARMRPDEVPRTIRFVDPAVTKNVSVIFEDKLTKAQAMDYVKQCETAVKMDLSDESETAKKTFRKIKELSTIANQRRAGPKEIVLSTDFGDVLLLPKRNKEKKGAKIKNTKVGEELVYSSFAIIMAHEFAHILLTCDKGFVYRARSLSDFDRSISKSEVVLKSKLYCSVISNQWLVDLKKIQKRSRAGYEAFGRAVRNNHRKEYDASMAGFYIALKAGYNPKWFGVSYSPEVQESFSHPAEKKMKGFVEWLAERSKYLGL